MCFIMQDVRVFTRQIIASQQVQISRLRTFSVCERVGFLTRFHNNVDASMLLADHHLS